MYEKLSQVKIGHSLIDFMKKKIENKISEYVSRFK